MKIAILISAVVVLIFIGVSFYYYRKYRKAMKDLSQTLDKIAKSAENQESK